MKYLIVVWLCTLATAKVTVQGVYAKKNIKTVGDATLFNGLIFFFAALLFLGQAISGCGEIWFFSVLFGILSVVFQTCYSKALSIGNASVTVLIVNLSMIIPIAVSVFAFDERLSVARMSGILLTLVTFFVVADVKKTKKFNLKWILLAMAAMLANGALGVIQKLFGKSNWEDQTGAFVSRSYIVAAVVSMIAYLVLRRKENTSRKRPHIIFAYAAATGIILAVFQLFNTYAISTVNGTFLFPAYSGGCIILSTVSGFLIFKERLNARQTIGVAIGVVALILMNF